MDDGKFWYQIYCPDKKSKILPLHVKLIEEPVDNLLINRTGSLIYLKNKETDEMLAKGRGRFRKYILEEDKKGSVVIPSYGGTNAENTNSGTRKPANGTS